MEIIIDENIRLELTAEKHAEGLLDALNKSRQKLAEFLPWVDSMQSVDDFKHYLRNCEALHNEKKEVSFVIMFNDKIVGRIGLHHLNLQNKIGAIGYWLTEKAEKKGIITKSCKRLISFGFNEFDLNRIEIKCATTNSKSQAIPIKLNFFKEGILRQAELVNNKFLDLYVYSMLKQDW